MNAMIDFLSGPEWQHLAMALLHTLWQGAAVVAALALALRFIPAHRPEARYGTAFFALLGLLLCGLVTWSILDFDWQKHVASTANVRDDIGVRPAAIHGDEPETKVVPSSSEGRVADGPFGKDAGSLLACVLSAWLAGVALMMVRMVWMVARLRRFVSGPEVRDNRIRQWTDELRHVFQVGSIRIIETAEEFGPAVLGIVRPILALPASMLTGLPPEAVRAIVAHELAHIRRHDYLLNLVQMVVEAVLFFNPAVWWINRQIRIEREACCDAMAAQALGQPLVLAESLSLWAEHVASRSSAAMAFAGTGRHGPRLLLDRVLRIVLPDYRPQTPISPLGSLGLFLGGIVALGVLSCGTSAVVELAAKALTPAQRMERVADAQKEYSPSFTTSNHGDVMLSGVIHTEDGKPVPKQIYGVSYSRSGNNSVNSSFSVKTSEFSTKVPVGTIKLGFSAKGYAPAIVGPFIGNAGKSIAGIQVTLHKGFPVRVRMVDGKGKPVAGAMVSGNIDGVLGPGQQVTDAEGTAVFPHAAAGNYTFSANKAGFEPFYSTSMRIDQDEASATLAMTRTRSVHGLIRFADGQPVVGAEVREFYSVAPLGAWDETATQGGRVLATTDAHGRFALDQLYKDRRYCLLIVTQQHRRQLLDNVSADSSELRVTLEPELTVTGQIKGDLEKLAKKDGKPVVCCQQHAKLQAAGGADVSVGSVQAIVKPMKGGGQFIARNLFPGLISISAGAHKAQVEVGVKRPMAHVVIDLTKPLPRPVKRQVVIDFAAPEGTVSPQGKVYVQVNPASADHWREKESKEMSVVNGRISFSVVPPATVSYDARSLIGYWFPSGSMRVEADGKPLMFMVTLVPAGAIAGQVLNADGAPAVDNISVRVTGEYAASGSTISGGFGQNNVNTDAHGRFFIGPLPLGGTFTLCAQRRYTVQLSSPIRPDAAHPVAKATLRFPATTAAKGRVLDSSEHPIVSLPFTLTFLSPLPPTGSSGSSWGSDLVTDGAGQFHIDGLSLGVGHYSLTFSPRRNFCPLRVPLPLDGKPMIVHLHRGLTLEGKVVDDKTGWPIPGVKVWAMPQPFSTDASICEAETPTDREGRFRFSNLEDRLYQWNTRETASDKTPDAERIRRPGKQPLVLRITLPKWSTLQPQRPGS